MVETTAIYPGTFDPITLGHINMIERASRLFPQIIVAVAFAHHKKTLFDFATRKKMTEDACKNFQNVRVMGFDGLMVQFAKENQANILIRGLRSGTDWDYEWQLSGMNKALNSDVETIFLATDAKYQHISSTFVREIAKIEGSARIVDLVPDCVVAQLKEKFGI